MKLDLENKFQEKEDPEIYNCSSIEMYFKRVV